MKSDVTPIKTALLCCEALSDIAELYPDTDFVMETRIILIELWAIIASFEEGGELYKQDLEKLQTKCFNVTNEVDRIKYADKKGQIEKSDI